MPFGFLSERAFIFAGIPRINRNDLIGQFNGIADALPDEALRDLVNNHFRKQLGRKPKQEEIAQAKMNTLQEFPDLIEIYIRGKEETGDKAESVSGDRVRFTQEVYVEKLKRFLIDTLFKQTPFYETVGNTKDEARKRVMYLKDVIENKDGYRIFWGDGEAIRSEQAIQILYRLTWCGSVSDVNREVNNGRGPVDFKASRGALDKTLIEFKLASNSHLKRNLQNQVDIYLKANDTDRALKVITYFTMQELEKVEAVLKELKLTSCEDIIRIDARKDNKPSASTA
jgi:hypothetical protein